jgi:hypothetical protein
MSTETTARGSRLPWIVGGLAIAIVVVVGAAFLASGDPDGLERVAEDQGFDGAGQDSPFELIGDYVFPGLEEPLATIVAGIIGVVVVFGIVWLIGLLVARRRRSAPVPR